MSGSHIVVIAGWGHSGEDLSPLASLLADRDRITLTSPAELFLKAKSKAGAAGLPRGASVYASELQSIVNRFEKPCVLLGWSMGAVVVLETLTKLTVEVTKAVIISGTARFCSTRDHSAGIPEKNLRAMEIGLADRSDDVLRTFFRSASFPALLADETIDTKVEQAVHTGIDTLSWGLNYLHQTDLRDVVHEAGVPVLVLHGRHDRIVPWHAGEFLSQQLPRHRFALREDAGHCLPLDQPESVAADIRSFLKETG